MTVAADPPLVVRSATRDDIPAIAALAAKLVTMHHDADASRFFLPDDPEGGYAWWLGQEIDRDEVLLLVATRGARVVGYAYGRIEGRNWNQLLDAHASMQDLWVEPEERAHGVGAALVRAGLEAARAKGAPRAVLYVAAGNARAQELFAKMGFRPTMVEMTCDLDG